ncbi:hypothetical protein McanMca71_005692 [Microsporum canis]
MVKYRSTSAVAYAGPLLTPAASLCIPSPPPAKRMRMKEGSSENNGPPIIGDEDIHNEDYRCGGPDLVKLPALSRYIPDNGECQLMYDQLMDEVLLVLERWHVDLKGRTLLQRAHHEASGTETWTNTLLIPARKHELDDTWLEACKEIREILVNNNLGDTTVEMIDERASQRVLSAPIPRTNPFYSTWPDLRLTILNILGDSEWTMLSPQLRGVSMEPKTITIVILVKEDSTFDWIATREAVVDTLDSQGLHHIAVEIRRCSLLQFRSSPLVEGFLAKDDWSSKPCMGGSIGAHSSALSSSTFGGFLEIQHPSGEWKQYGLTTHHCVTAIKSTADWDRHGIKPGDPENELTLDYPSLRDHNLAIDHYREEIELFSKLETYTSAKQRLEEEDPSVSRNERQAYEYVKGQIEVLEETLVHAHNFYQHGQLLLGKVYASSGYRMNPNKRILDWALIEVPSDRTTQNKLPTIDDVPKSCRAAYLPTSKVLQDAIPLKAGEMGVCKIGRTTGFSEGRLGEIRETDIQCWVKDEDGHWDKTRGMAYLIHRRAPSVTFGEPGDSGSFVFSLDGSFVGLYLGGDRDAGTGLFMEASDLFEDIKLITGARDVRIPQ